MKSERGNTNVLFALLAVFVLGLAFMGIASALPGMKAGADTIGNAAGNAIDAAEQEWRNLDWQVTNGTVVSFWVNHQRIWANKHSVQRHQDDAHKSAQCYNDHGAFISMANPDFDFYLPCREEDGTVRLTIWKRESATSNRFHMVDAYTPKNGVWNKIEFWLRNTHRATRAQFPQDAVFIIDNVIP